MILRVGLTGGVASGKSIVSRLLAEHGAAVRDADAVVRRAYLPGRRGAAAVAELFGDRVLTAAGGVDHAALAAIVLADAGARRRLEGVVHPIVRDEVAAWIAELEALEQPPLIAVVEAALLVETGAYRDYHRLVAVSADVRLRRSRALAAGWSATAFTAVVTAQLEDRDREAAADYVVRNDEGAIELCAGVDRVWRELRTDAALLAAGKPLLRTRR
jgi:dephospho-CoA kinase